MDQFIAAAYVLAVQLLPIIGVAVLIILIVLLTKLLKLIDKLTGTLDRSHSTLNLIDMSLEKVQAPLESAAKVAKTIDEAHEFAVSAIKNSAAYLRKNHEEIKNKIDQLLNRRQGFVDLDDIDDSDVL